MKSNQTNAIANVTATLVGNKAVAQNRKASKPVITLGKELALKGISAYLKGATAKDGAIVTMNEGLKPFIDAKVKLLNDGNEIPDWTFHDLRRTAATGMAALRIPVEVIEQVLNHKSGKLAGVAGIYNRHGYEQEMRLALEKWNDKIIELSDSYPK